ncbi:MAG: hypothetical protein J7K96_00405, partial [Desulfobacteraceae bacterium]|nr:hypothetical protein [Desulfobacteraceae bacterium]
MYSSPNINNPPHNPIVDLDSIILDYPEHDTVVDLNSIEQGANKKRPRFNLHSIRANAPALQLIARLSLPVMGILYFATNAAPPLLVPLFIVVLICLLFLFYHLYLYRQTTNLGFSKKIMISANQL